MSSFRSRGVVVLSALFVVASMCVFDLPQSVQARTVSSLPTLSYPLKFSTSPSHKYLVDQKGTPVFLVGEAATSLSTQVSDADVVTYLSDRASRGYNAIWLNLIEHLFSANAPNDFNNTAPFTGATFSTPNETYFVHQDYVISQAAKYGITVFLTPAYVGFGCGNQGWYSEMTSASDATMTAWGQYVGNRYKDYKNIVWVIGGDADPATCSLKTKLDEVATGILSNDPNHLITSHSARGESGLDVWSGYSWLTLNDIYNLPTDIPSKANTEYRRSDFIPFFLFEDYFEGEHSQTALSLRTEAYDAVLSGAYIGRFFGNYAIWDFSTPSVTTDPWLNQLSSVGSIGQANLGSLFRSREHWKMVPDIDHKVVTAGYGSGSTLAVTSRTSDGQSIILYMPTSRAVTVDMSKISDASAKAWWYNPQAATSTLIGTYAASGSQVFTPLAVDPNDVVLVIDALSAALPAPGTSVSLPPRTVTGSTSLIGPSTLYSGFSGWWTFDGKNTNWRTGMVSDKSGNGKSGSLINFSTTSSPVQGKVGQALSFDGVSTYVSVGTGPTSVQTVSFWMKVATSTNEQILELNGSQTVSCSSAGTISANGFGGTTVIYVDGVVSSTIDAKWHLVTITTTSSFSASAMNIGRISTAYYGGILDDVRTYSRVLSQQEITELYNSTVGNKLDSSVVGAVGLNSGLVGWWTLDGKDINWRTGIATDRSGNGNSGLLVNLSTSSSPVVGKIGQALKFDQRIGNQYVDVGGNASIRPTSAGTISAWAIFPPYQALNSTQYQAAPLICSANSSTDRNGYCMYPYYDGKFYVEIDNASAFNQNAGYTYANDGKWRLMTMTWDSSIIRLYENGVQVDSVAESITPTYTSNTYIGAEQLIDGKHGMIGSIDDARIYNRALTAQEVLQLYRVGH